MIITTKAYPRVGFIGNPSDGFFGKTISFTFSNFQAQVILYESPQLEILPNNKDHSCFSSVEALVRDVRLHGYYGGIRLLKAVIKRFYDYCRDRQIALPLKNFTIRYCSDIPHSVGLAGSSAIIVAALHALMAFYHIDIPKPIQANLVLSAEMDELKIAAGLQDRVIQVYTGLVFMDFHKKIMDSQGFGLYEELDPKLLPPLYIAYHDDFSEPTEIFHNNIRERFNRGDPVILDAMKFWADLAQKARTALLQGRHDKLARYIDANFDRRRKIYRLNPQHLRMVEIARSVGATAKFTGSGGAIVGTYESPKMFQKLKAALASEHIKIIKPRVVLDRKDTP